MAQAFDPVGFQSDTFDTGTIVSAQISQPMGDITGSLIAQVVVKPVVSATMANFTSAAAAQVQVHDTVSASMGLITGVIIGNTRGGARVSNSMGQFTGSLTLVVKIVEVVSQPMGDITGSLVLKAPDYAVVNAQMDNFTSIIRLVTTYNFPSYPPPDYPVQVTATMNIQEQGYGAYKERAPNGINANKPKTVLLVWSTLSVSDRALFEAFLDNRGGAGRFAYQLPHWPKAEVWVCPKWEFDYNFLGYHTLKATFERRVDQTFG